MTAADVEACLALRWPDESYLLIREAPTDSARQGRKLDLLVIALWQSRGLERDGVEIKVSASDWKRELDQHDKADFWWRKTHRFWVAVPAKLAARVKDELPGTWGLLSCEPDKPPKVVVRATKREAEPIAWPTCVGLMRAASDAGRNALYRAEQRGWDRGHEAAEKQMEARSVDGRLRKELDSIRAKVAAFEAAAGCQPFTSYWPEPAGIGELVALLRAAHVDPDEFKRQLEWAASTAAKQGSNLTEVAVRIRHVAEKITEVAQSNGLAVHNAEK